MATLRGRNAGMGPVSRPGLARPLESLGLVLPLLVFSEVAALCSSSHAGLMQQDRVVAFHLLRFFFELFGSTAVLMPALAVVAILLGTHVASGQPWRVRRTAVARMYVESLALALPLIVVHRWVRLASGGTTFGWLGESALGISAGIYEELVFRLILISAIVIICSDLLKWPPTVVLVGGVLISAVLFAAHHHPPVGVDPFEPGRFLFRTLAGVYLGAIFVLRGYGPSAGTHAAYNLIVLSQA